MPNLLAIMASSRTTGNTNRMLEIFLEGLDESWKVDILRPIEMSISPCKACYGCKNGGKCVIKDDMSVFYQKLKEAALVVFATPVYFNSIPGPAKNLVDRTQNFWTKKFILKDHSAPEIPKKGILLANGGALSYEDQFLGVQLVLDYFFKACDIEFLDEVHYSHTDSVPVSEAVDLEVKIKSLSNQINGLFRK